MKKTKKSSKKTHIAIVVDRSGSMSSIRKSALDGLNETINGIVQDGDLGGETDVTVILFDNEIESVLENVPAKMMTKFDEEDYVPRGTTALYDAIVQAVNSITDVDETDDTGYLVTVISDGHENASKTPQNEVSSLIKQLEGQGNWTFNFMLANQDIHQFAAVMGASLGNVAAFAATDQGVQTAYSTMTVSNSSYLRSRSAGVTQRLDSYVPADNNA
jgi:uncharacterized protein YegL